MQYSICIPFVLFKPKFYSQVNDPKANTTGQNVILVTGMQCASGGRAAAWELEGSHFDLGCRSVLEQDAEPLIAWFPLPSVYSMNLSVNG